MNRAKSTVYHGWGTQPIQQPTMDLQFYINRIAKILSKAEDTAIYTLLERNGIDPILLQIHHHTFSDHETFILFKNNHQIDHISVNKPELLN